MFKKSFLVIGYGLWTDIGKKEFKKVWNEVGINMDPNKPLRLGFRSFASKLMDLDSFKVFTF